MEKELAESRKTIEELEQEIKRLKVAIKTQDSC